MSWVGDGRNTGGARGFVFGGGEGEGERESWKGWVDRQVRIGEPGRGKLWSFGWKELWVRKVLMVKESMYEGE